MSPRTLAHSPLLKKPGKSALKQKPRTGSLTYPVLKNCVLLKLKKDNCLPGAGRGDREHCRAPLRMPAPLHPLLEGMGVGLPYEGQSPPLSNPPVQPEGPD